MNSDELLQSFDERVIQFGDITKDISRVELKAGSLELIYEQGNLRRISIGSQEILRMIYSAVRGAGWLTAPGTITDEKIEKGPDTFSIDYKCRFQLNEIDFEAQYHIKGHSDSTISFEMQGAALSTFMKNRLGFCVLHPIAGISGTPCQIAHSDGSVEEFTFPKLINPHAPFKDITTMKWQGSSAYEAELIFSGDIFETEDQRNWTDTSYKTFCTPLSLPKPVQLVKGDTINQKILLKVQQIKPSEKETENLSITVYPDQEFSFPKIGIGRSTRLEPIGDDEMAFMGKLRFSHYRVDLYLFRKSWLRIANEAFVEADMMNYKLEIALFFDDEFTQQAEAFCKWAGERASQISHVAIFNKTAKVTPDELISGVLSQMREALSGVKIGAGTNANFVQLNRNPPASNDLDFLTFAVHPQEHAFDNTTIIENAEAQRYAAESGKVLAGDRDIRISPVTIQRRFNANVENYESPSESTEYPWQVDNRMMSLFGALWTLSSFKNLSESQVASITYYETVGERGIMQGELPTAWPDSFKSFPGMVFPVYFLCRFLLGRQDYKVIKSTVSDNTTFESLFLKKGKKQEIVIANFSKSDIKVQLNGVFGYGAIKTLNTTNFRQAVVDSEWLNKTQETRIALERPIHLEPISINFITVS